MAHSTGRVRLCSLFDNVMIDFAFHHIGIAVTDLTSASESMQRFFGYRVSSGPFDDPIQKVSVCFLKREGERTGGASRSPFPDRASTRERGRHHHTCYMVPDMKAAIDHLQREECFLLGEPVSAKLPSTCDLSPGW